MRVVGSDLAQPQSFWGEDMKYYILLLLSTLWLAPLPVLAAQSENGTVEIIKLRTQCINMDCDTSSERCKSEEVTCKSEMHGRCGKRKGDWYGASQPVANEGEARTLLLNYFTGQGYTVSELKEKKWGYKAEVINKEGKVVDCVMIDKRSGRIRSLN